MRELRGKTRFRRVCGGTGQAPGALRGRHSVARERVPGGPLLGRYAVPGHRFNCWVRDAFAARNLLVEPAKLRGR